MEKKIIPVSGELDFSVSSIISLFGDKRLGIHSYPKSFWINKLGNLCLNDKDTDGRGAKFILDTFVLDESETKENRIIALCNLLILKKRSEEIEMVLKAFQEDEKNKDLFVKAEAIVEEYFFREELL